MMYVRNVVIHRTVHTIWSRLCSYMGSTEKASMVNALQFMASSFCMITLARSTLRNSRSASVRGGSSSSNLVDKRYASTLTEMFKATKVPNKRHGLNCSSADTTENIFRSRCEFFRKAVVDYNLQNVKFIHIAGTKGKGSTCEYIAAAMRSAGLRVGVFTSPHLHTARERIKIGNELISKEDLVRIGQNSIRTMEKFAWTVFFDTFLFTALQYFGEKQVDYIILECGIGGRYDSTNFVIKPVACIITSISLDHQAILGDTIEKIAWQKAGIIKSNCKTFTLSSQKNSVLQVFRREAQLHGSELIEASASSSILKDLIVGAGSIIDDAYSVQVENACLAAHVLNELKVSTNGMKNAFWPCRMETFSVQDDIKIILDGCHNGESVKNFLMGIRCKYPNRKVLSVFGGGSEKCIDEMVEEVIGLSDEVLFTQSKHFKAMSENELNDLYSRRLPIVREKYPKHALLVSLESFDETKFDINDSGSGAFEAKTSTVSIRLKYAMQMASSCSAYDKYVICVYGSLFTAAEARESLRNWYPEKFRAEDWVHHCDEI